MQQIRIEAELLNCGLQKEDSFLPLTGNQISSLYNPVADQWCPGWKVLAVAD